MRYLASRAGTLFSVNSLSISSIGILTARPSRTTETLRSAIHLRQVGGFVPVYSAASLQEKYRLFAGIASFPPISLYYASIVI
jgi:hypothetical protein